MQWKVDFVQQSAMTSSVAGPRRSSKALPKAKLAPKKGHGHWWSAAALIHYSFLNPSETMTSEKYAQQTSETHWKLQCLQPTSANRTGPSPLHENARMHISQPTFQKLNELGYKVLPHPQYSPELLPQTNTSSVSTTFAVKAPLQTAGGRKCFQESVESWSTDFYSTGINQLIFLLV